MNRPAKAHIRCHALRLKQSESFPVYLFALSADQLDLIADVSRVSRTDQGNLDGYQRSIAQDHVADIASYLNGPDPLFPNGLILALPSSVRFEKRRGPGNDDGAAIAGEIVIPVPSPEELKPGWIVDGQQRWMALKQASNRQFPVPIAAFIADTIEMQREQFIRVNSVKPLDKRLVTELLPEVTLSISPRLTAKKVPSALVDQLNLHPDSPFLGLIRRPSMGAGTSKRAVVQDSSLISALEESLTTANGSLFPYRNLVTSELDLDSIWWTIITYWSAVREVFPEAWGKAPAQSRLMHGAGIKSMGRLMDKIMSSVDPADPTAPERVRTSLELVEPHCRWTAGSWDDLNDMPWNELQNIPRHVRMLSNLLVRLYVSNRVPSA